MSAKQSRPSQILVYSTVSSLQPLNHEEGMDRHSGQISLVQFIERIEKELSSSLDAIISDKTLSRLRFLRGSALPTLDDDAESADAGPLFFEPYPNDDLSSRWVLWPIESRMASLII